MSLLDIASSIGNVDDMRDIPMSAKLPSNFVLRDCNCRKEIVLDEGNNYTLNVEGNVVIEAETPIVANDRAIIKGVVGSTLLLRPYSLQPCIGPKTHTGMSYDRWSPSGHCPTEIVIDGVKVICESSVKNFSIGKYGTNEIPKVTLLNGGELECPEMTGERVVIYQAVAPAGSTKISSHMQYGIKKDGQSDFELYSDEKKKLYRELEELNANMCQYVELDTEERNIKEAISLLKIKPTLSVKRILESGRGLSLRRGADILSMPENTLVYEEWMYELSKANYIEKAFYGFGEDVANTTAINATTAIYWLSNLPEGQLTDFAKEVMYELIPAYQHNFERRGHYQEALAFLENNRNLVNEEMLQRIEEHREEILNKFT